jgi:hypothetical protein
MFPQISLTPWHPVWVSADKCDPIHVAGNQPNHMNRFVPTNWLEVLFVN